MTDSSLSEKALQEKTRKDYQHRMKKNKYWRKGWKAARRGRDKFSDNPYTIPEDVKKLLEHRTFWLMGFEEYDYSEHAKKKRSKEMKRGKSDVAVHDISHIRSTGEWEKKKKHRHHHYKDKKKKHG